MPGYSVVTDAGAGEPAAGSGEFMMMMLADARFPTGAHTQSAGLEPAINSGMPPARIADYLRVRLRTVVAVEAGAAVVARQACADHIAGVLAAGELTERLAAVDAAWRARTISPAQRQTSVLLGRGYSRLIVRLWPSSPVSGALARMSHPGRAVALGAAGALAGLSGAQLARVVGYDDVQTVAAAALKISPLDPVDATGWVLNASDPVERMVALVADIVDIDQIPADGAPQLESWAEIHATTRQRLFSA